MNERLACAGEEHMKDEKLKLALEWYDSGAEKRDDFEAMIRNILAQPEQEPVAWMDADGDVLSANTVDGTGLRNIPLYTAPPVPPEIIADANRYRWLRDRSENVIIDIVSSRQWTTVEGYKKQLDDLIDRELAKATPECLEMAEVITEPPNKEWVGLTDEEKKEIERQSVFVEGAVRLTEAKLKEKNNG
jgi:hypothetical protein